MTLTHVYQNDRWVGSHTAFEWDVSAIMPDKNMTPERLKEIEKAIEGRKTHHDQLDLPYPWDLVALRELLDEVERLNNQLDWSTATSKQLREEP